MILIEFIDGEGEREGTESGGRFVCSRVQGAEEMKSNWS